MTSYRVMKTDEFKDAIFYRISCAHSSAEHDLDIEFERDVDFKDDIFLNLYSKLAWSSYWKDDDKWYKNLWWRIKGAFKIIFKGYVEVHESFILEGEEHIDSFINALEEGKKYVKRSEYENNSEVVGKT